MVNLFLRVIGLLLAAYGGWLYLDPGYLIKLLELEAGTPARTELRAMYGGLQLAFGVCLLFAAQGDARTRQLACALVACCFTGLATARVAGMIVEGIDDYNLYACLFEAASAIIAILCYQRLRREQSGA